MQGRYILFPGTPREIVIPNSLTDTGELEFLKMIFRADVATVASGGNFYVGLTQVVPSDSITFAAILAAEPTIGVNGYARVAVTRDAAGWPTTSVVDGETAIRTGTLNFSAVGGDFDKAITRPFLCDVATGSAGNVFSLGAPLTSAITVLDGETLPIIYEAYLY